MSATPRRPPRIVFTGGPGAGKTTALAAVLLKRANCVLASETATLLFQNEIRHPRDDREKRIVQRGIYRIQSEWEELQSQLCPDRILLCDRGSLDSAAYWPDGSPSFFDECQTTIARETARYYAVLFFETCAAGGLPILANNSARTEDPSSAVWIDRRLRTVWEHHPRFHFIPYRISLEEKIALAEKALGEILAGLPA